MKKVYFLLFIKYFLFITLIDFIIYAKDFRYLIIINILSFISYALLFLYIKFREKENLKKISVILVVIITLLIDGKILIFAISLCPLRSPFATIFPMFGLLTAYLYYSNKKWFLLIFTFSIIIFVSSHLYIIPKIILSMENVDNKIIKRDLFSYKFLNSKKDTILLSNQLKKCNYIDYYFVGCGPCIQKKTAMKKVESQIISKDFASIYICDGSISTFQKFIKNINLENENIFLYDYDSVLYKVFPNERIGFPLEMIFKRKVLFHTSIGYTEESEQLFIKDRLTKIKKIIDEDN